MRRLLEIDVDVRSTTIVATAPWQWPAIRRVAAARRVFDCGDDWRYLIPHRAAHFRSLYQGISTEADAIVVVNEAMIQYFDAAQTEVVRNGVGDDVLNPSLTDRPRDRRLVYIGTLSQRFDEALVGSLMDSAEDWHLDLYGPCSYPRMGERPSFELQRLLDRLPHRVRWHGPIERPQLAAALDTGRTMLVPHRPEFSVGQDTMKLYEYAARGRPVVSTRWDPRLGSNGPPHLALADDADGFLAALGELEMDPPERVRQRRAWAESHRWTNRWDRWSSAIFGRDPSAMGIAPVKSSAA